MSLQGAKALIENNNDIESSRKKKHADCYQYQFSVVLLYSQRFNFILNFPGDR